MKITPFAYLFVSGVSNSTWSTGQVCYRIPSLLSLDDDGENLIAFASERIWEYSNVSQCSDESLSSIVQRRSTDGGKTWGPQELVVPSFNGQKETERHSWSLYDSSSKTIFIFSNDDVNGPTSCDCNIVYKTSDDGGETYSDNFTYINAETGVYGMGLTHSITHTSGRVVGCMRKICRNSCPADYASKSFFSDDNGATWNSSDWLHAGTTECQLAELPNGDLYLTSRPYTGWDGQKDVRLASYSTDVGSTWSDTIAEPNLIDFAFADEGSIASDPASGTIVFLHPFSETRSNMTLYQGYFNTETEKVEWSTSATTTVYSGPSEYSDVQVLDSGKSVGALFERGNYDAISFSIVPLN
ncbi:hypothetical protein TL16_g04075 [Triparma laevis f. inornata]|uniref:Sialidase domain-containing protein n=2 Tax=Triparma laevis TaxID=1534972 RepID=A0A9W7A536_9STRA|nr:hypothetical protein TrLO_g14588 [Triparma laevis f. longispina]GMH64926.1 hypothetical protein TL16_g04075 [Triparma laevis f. inornata]